ncbi:MAG: hypothetical protein WB441_03030 [Nocardioidaceae bacterium]
MAPTAPTAGAGDVHSLLRREVLALRARESRRVFDASVHVGVLGGPRTGIVVRALDLPVLDASLRADLVSALLDLAQPAWSTVWLVRPGTPESWDADLAWWSAARVAFGMHGRQPDGCYVLTRSGWRDVLTDETRVWVRLRR